MQLLHHHPLPPFTVDIKYVLTFLVDEWAKVEILDCFTIIWDFGRAQPWGYEKHERRVIVGLDTTVDLMRICGKTSSPSVAPRLMVDS